MKTKNATQFYAVGRCLVIVTAAERNLMAKLLRQAGKQKLAAKVRSSKVV